MEREFFIVVGVFPVELLAYQVSNRPSSNNLQIDQDISIYMLDIKLG